MAPLTLKAAIRPPGDRLILTCKDAAGRHLEIHTIVFNPTVRIDGGAPILLSDPRLQAGGAAVVYELPERIGPGDAVVLDAPVGWALTTNGAVPALASFKVQNLAEAPEGLETQKPITLDLISAQVLASGRALKLVFASEEPPADRATFVDWRRSLTDQLVLSGGRSRASLQFAGCSVARGQNDAYVLDTEPGADTTATPNTSLSFYQGDTLLGTIPPVADRNERQQVTITGATGGTFKLTLEGKTTAAIPFNATVAAVQAAIGKAGISVWGSPGSWTVGFGGQFAGSNRPLIVADGSGLTGDDPQIAVTVVQEGVNAVKEITAQFRALMNAVPVPDDCLSDYWLMKSPTNNQATTPAQDGPQSYTLTVTDGTTSYTTEPIAYTVPNDNVHTNALAAAMALNAVLGADCVTGACPQHRPQDIQLVFRREWGCPIWPITAVTVGEPSDPELLETDGGRVNLTITSPGASLHASVAFENALGCRDLDLSMTASDPTQGIVFRRLIQGDQRYRWNAYFYLDDPAEVIAFGEELTLSAPAGLLAGSNPDGEATGDQTAAFADFAVTNRSWAGPDGDLSPELCHVTDAANGVDDGWERWRSEPPPAAWVGVANPPMRIMYVDPDYDGSNGTSRLNDPTRPYTNFGRNNTSWRDWIGTVNSQIPTYWDVPKIVLVKKGAAIPRTAVNGWPVVSGTYEAPVIVSTYWMASDGPEPSSYATVSQDRSALDFGGVPYLGSNMVIHGLVLDCNWSFGVPVEDFVFWDCVWPPTVNSPQFPTVVDWEEIVHRGSLVRCTIYDRWSDLLVSGGGRTVFIQGVYGDSLYDVLFDQTTFLRNGFIGFTDGFDGGPNSYTAKLGNDPAAMLGSPYKTVFVHDLYASSVLGTPTLLFNCYGGQCAGTALNVRTGVVMYGCVRYGDADNGVSPCGDPDSARAASSHIRRNLFLKSRGVYCIRVGTWRSLEIVASTVNVVEDNLILEPASISNFATGIGTSDIGTLTNCRGIVIRQNTLVDQGFYWGGENGQGPPPDLFRLVASRNLLIRTADYPADNTLSRLGSTAFFGNWAGRAIDRNLYLISGGARDGDFNINGSVGLTGWQAAGLDVHSAYVVQDFAPAVARPEGGHDLLVEHFAKFEPTVTDAAGALARIRDRRPGTWDDNLHAPLGTDGGLLKAAETAYRPTGVTVKSDTSAYFGALNYSVGDLDPTSPTSSRRPPRITPQQLQRVSR